MNEISLAEYRQQIESTIEQGHYEEAVAHGRRIVEEYPRDIGAYWLLGRALLGAGQEGHAVDMLRRVLSTNPEYVPGWVGVSEVARGHGELEAAVWYMERAFELDTDNETVAEELRQLYGKLRGDEPRQLQLTQGALARLYLKAGLVTRAISELRQLLEEHPDRLDLKVALAEALWRDGQRLRASEVCQEIVDEHAYNLKSNLILGEIWTSSGRVEGELYLEYARAVDPENQMAQRLFGTASPLPPESPHIAPLDYSATAEEKPAAWRFDWGALATPEPFALTDTGEVMEARTEPPAWLQEVAAGAAEMHPRVETVAEEDAATPEETLDQVMGEEQTAMEDIPEEEIVKWLSQLEEKGPTSEPEEQEEKIPPETPEEEQIPAWLTGLGPKPPAGEAAFDEAEEGPLPEPAPVEIPEWLLNLVPPEEEPRTTPASDTAAELREEAMTVEEAASLEEPEGVSERLTWWESRDVTSGDEALAWLQQLAEGEAEPPTAEAEAKMDELALEQAAALEALEGVDELPTGFSSEDVTSEDEALSWLRQLAQGEQEPLPAQAEAEAEIEELALEEAAAPEEVERAVELPAHVPTKDMPSAEAALGWIARLVEGEEEPLPAEAEAKAAIEEIALDEAAAPEDVERAVELPAYLPTKDMPSAEAALGWIGQLVEGEEVEHPAQAPVPPGEPVSEKAEETLASDEAQLTEAIEEASVEDLEGYIAARRAYADEHTEDHEAWLELGRVLWQADRRVTAIESYDHLIASGELLNEVIPDLEDYAARSPDVDVQRALGDAYMKADRLADALDVYKRALASV